jgi:hypothetical protein
MMGDSWYYTVSSSDLEEHYQLEHRRFEATGILRPKKHTAIVISTLLLLYSQFIPEDPETSRNSEKNVPVNSRETNMSKSGKTGRSTSPQPEMSCQAFFDNGRCITFT